MGKAKTTKGRNGGPASPYDRPSGKKQQAPNNIFKFNTSSYGQHILKNPGIADAIVQKAFIKETDTVLEVGPGTGNISIRILEKARKLIAVEIDPRMAAEVTKRVQGKPEQRKLEVLLGDVIKMEKLPEFDVLVSNTPYQISSPLVFKILQMPKPPRCCVLMFQREFALRLTAKPGDSLYCRLSVNSQFWAKITHILKVGKKNFSPPPLVESAVVRIEPKVGSDRPNVSFEEWDGMLRICFNRRNKTLRASWFTKEVLGMVERNYGIWCSLNNVAIDDSPVDDAELEDDEVMDMDQQENVEPSAGDEEEGWGGIMDVDNDGDAADNDTTPSFFGGGNAAVPKTQSKRRKTRVALLVREKIRKVLEDDTKLADQRSGKLDETDFLKLLYAFNSENIHFS
ncbi:hypothetical protein PG995_009635 [Apiospora arundinis]